ncbi:MAG: hypothetical protein OXR62_06495 [Ahrensia sp.]|nr:hypothetical protein [Ahrensia sp.]
MTANKSDEIYGHLRLPTKIDDWEDRAPASLVRLTGNVGAWLAALEELAQTQLFSAMLRSNTYLWAMDNTDSIWLAVEELAIVQPEAGFMGYPRRRGYSDGVEQKKLGHPTLIREDETRSARIAGELALDFFNQRCQWVLNANSGRYCADSPPSESQLHAVAEEFLRCGVQVTVDDVL